MRSAAWPQDYMAIWTPGSTRQQRCDVVPTVLTALRGTMVAGDCVLATCWRRMLPLFEAAGWRLSYSLTDHQTSRETVVVAGAARPLDDAALRAVRGLDERNPALAERLYSCWGYGDRGHHPTCLAWGKWLCRRCGDVAFCTPEGLLEHERAHQAVPIR